MSDEKLINEIAEIWVANGGDAEGVMWNVSKIRDEVQRIIDCNNQKENEHE